jgi:hypothetical protein
MTSRQIKRQAANTLEDKDLMVKEKRTKKRSPRMAMIWKKTLRPNPSKRLKVELAQVTHTRIPKREPFTRSLIPPWLRHSELLCAP